MKCVTSLLLLHNMKALQKVIFIACFIKHRNKSQGIYYLPLNWVYLAATKKSYLQMLSSLLIHGSWPDCFCQPQNTGRYAHQTYSNVLARVVPFGGWCLLRILPAHFATTASAKERKKKMNYRSSPWPAWQGTILILLRVSYRRYATTTVEADDDISEVYS